MPKKLYEVMELPETATKEEIRRQYLKLSKKLHPDRATDLASTPKAKEEAGMRFNLMKQAYDILSDPDKRKDYDAGKINEKGEPSQEPEETVHATPPPQQKPFHQRATPRPSTQHYRSQMPSQSRQTSEEQPQRRAQPMPRQSSRTYPSNVGAGMFFTPPPPRYYFFEAMEDAQRFKPQNPRSYPYASYVLGSRGPQVRSPLEQLITLLGQMSAVRNTGFRLQQPTSQMPRFVVLKSPDQVLMESVLQRILSSAHLDIRPVEAMYERPSSPSMRR